MPRPKGARDSDYEAKRQGLLQRMLPRLASLDQARPSLRQLADAAEVTVPTLKHYFGGRSEVVTAVLEAFHARGAGRLAMLAQPTLPFAESIRDFAHDLLNGLSARRGVKLGDVFAVGLAEGLVDADIGPAALRYIIDPSVDALAARLDSHVAKGEMVAADTRAAALMLVAPLLIATLHQDQMQGARHRALDLPAMADELTEAFVRAYAASKS